MWIAGTSSTPALTQNAGRIQSNPAFLNFPARAGDCGRRGRDRAETPGLIGRGFLHSHNDSLRKRRSRGRAQWPAEGLSRRPAIFRGRKQALGGFLRGLQRSARLRRILRSNAKVSLPPASALAVRARSRASSVASASGRISATFSGANINARGPGP
jgi:hypothetical protein